jgi:thymidine phosphorylase
VNLEDFLPAEVIRSKRDGEVLSPEDIGLFVDGVGKGTISDEQVAALAMAIWFQGLNHEEQRSLTLAIRGSGTTLRWPGISGPVLDKHSTGGVGDCVSFAVGPVVAACGGFVPMISGRGLGHTGGTLDKLESFPGINVMPDIDTFQRWVRENGLAIVGQTGELAPADRRFYAVRDATATVDSIPLIVASILGKKLCEGLDGLVMDIKVGNGAFMTEVVAGGRLAVNIRSVAHSAGLPCTAVLSDMNQPLSRSAGNALEVREILDYLSGDRRQARFHEVSSCIAAEMLLLGGLADDAEEAGNKVQESLDSGAAAECFERLVRTQGGPQKSFENLADTLPTAPFTRAVFPDRAGFVERVDTRALGLAVVLLGGGRRQTKDRVDHSVGLAEIAAIGEPVGDDRPLAMLHARNEREWEVAREKVLAAYAIAEDPCDGEAPAVLGCYTDERS